MARAMTLVESNAPAHQDRAQEMLSRLMPHTGGSVRVGITGYPGAGKSTFIEALGNQLCDRDRRVAVLAVDPTSSLTKGSILGDKTRMENLCRRPEAFIRPSPSGGVLGGVARKSREAMLVLEAGGFDTVLVETVGVGQSETAVRDMVDFFLLILIAGAGDELQGIKRGVMELADALLINKADGDNKPKALAARAEFEQILHYLQPATPGWNTRVLAGSSKTGEGIPEVWDAVTAFVDQTKASGVFDQRRQEQILNWVRSMVDEHLETQFWEDEGVKAEFEKVKTDISEGRVAPTAAVDRLLGARSDA
jgi:LAO/AO transport system kinase